MILLDTTTRTLEVVLGAAKTTNNCTCVASYVDIAQTGFAMKAASTTVVNTNGTSAVTLVGNTTGSNTRQLKYASLFNNDTVPSVFTVRLNDNGTTRAIITSTLQVGETLEYNAEDGWITCANNGGVKLDSSFSGYANNYTVGGGQGQPTTTSFVMYGLGSQLPFTPKTTGNILLMISSNLIYVGTAAADVGIAWQLFFGSGTAPIGGAALTGFPIGAVQQFTTSVAPTAAADVNIPVFVQGIVMGLNIGTTYWFDLGLASIGTANTGFFGSSQYCSAVEF